MNSWLKLMLMGVSVLVLSCGGSKTQTETVPTAPPPSSSPTQDLTPPPPPTVDPRLPDLSLAVPVNLSDKTQYSALQDLSRNVFPPLVGDPLISMRLTKTRNPSISGTILFAFEDQQGFWGAELPSFEGTGYHDATRLDLIFADDELVFRTVGTLSGDNLNAILYYRLRLPGENQCKKVVVSCEVSGYPSGYYPSPYPQECSYPVDTVTPCRAYMNLNHSSVKSVGSFKAKYSDWATLPEAK